MPGQDMGQWGGSQWASTSGSTQQLAPRSPSASGTTPTTGDPAAGPLGNGQQNNAPFMGSSSTPTLGGGGDGGVAGDSASPGANNSKWSGYSPYYDYNTMQPIPVAPGRGAKTNETWNGAASDSDPWAAYGLDEGGVVPDGDNDGGDVTGTVTDPVDAVTAVQKALAAGRQSMGIPASIFGTAAAGDDDDDGDQAGNIPARPAAPGGDTPDQNPFPTKTPNPPFGKRMSGNVPARPAGPGGEGEDTNPFQTKTTPNPFGKRKQVPGAAAGGVIDDGDMDDPSSAGTPPQPTDNQPAGSGAGAVNMQALKQYVMGAGAMPADQAMALEQQADPQGQMDPALRKLLAVANAGDPRSQFGLLQHYRQRFNLLNAYAQAAAKGGQGRPADLAESAQAATRAMHNVPTGHAVSFQPAGNGVAMSIKKLGAGKQQGLDAGGGVVSEDDPETQAAPDNSGAAAPDIPVDMGGMPGSSSLATTAEGEPAQAPTIIPLQKWLSFLTNTNWDKIAEKGPEAVKEAATAAPGGTTQPDQGVIQTGPQPQSSGMPGQGIANELSSGQKAPPPAPVNYTPAKPQPRSGLPDIPGYDQDLINRAYHATGEIGSPQFYNYLERLTSARAGNTQQLTLEEKRAEANRALWGAKEGGTNYRAQLRADYMTGNSRAAVAARAQYAQLTGLSREIDTLRNLGAKDADPRLAPLLQQQNVIMQGLAASGALENRGQQQPAPAQSGSPNVGLVLRPDPRNPNRMMQRQPNGTWVPYQGQ